MEKKIELLGGKKIKVKYIPGGNSMQMSPSKEEQSKRGFIKLEESVIAALNVADDVVLEEGEMTKSELKKLKKKMKMKRREERRRGVKVKEEKKVKEERGKYSGLWTREPDGAKVFYFLYCYVTMVWPLSHANKTIYTLLSGLHKPIQKTVTMQCDIPSVLV